MPAVGDGDGGEGISGLPMLLCGECGTEGGPAEQWILSGLQQGQQGPVSSAHALGNCECCGSDQMTVRVPRDSEVGGAGKAMAVAGAPIAEGRGRGWDPKMADFEETRVGYDSIKTLLSRVRRGKGDKDDIARSFSFVGVLDDRYTAVQLETKLLLLDHSQMCRHLFYQLCLRRFACAPRIALSRPVPVLDFVRAALDLPEAQWDASEDRNKDEIAAKATAVLVENAEMLDEYFSVSIAVPGEKEGGDEGGEDESAPASTPSPEKAELRSLPILLDGYTPLTTALPMFLLRLATDSQWDSELECFDSISSTIAALYSTLVLVGGSVKTTTSNYVPGSRADPSLAILMEAMLFPAIKAMLISPKEMFSDDTVVQVASLDQLYKVFERC